MKDSVASAEKLVENALNHLEDLDQIHAAIPVAEHLLQIRTTYQGNQWWETIDARIRLTGLQQFALMPDQARSKLAEASRLHDRAQQLFQEGHYEKTLEPIQQAMSIELPILGEQDYFYADEMLGLGLMHARLSNVEKAQPLLQQASKILKTTIGEQHPEYAMCLLALGDSYLLTSSFDEAEGLINQAIKIQRQTIGEPSADALVELGLLYTFKAKFGPAESWLRQALDTQRKAFGDQSLGYALILDRLALVYEATSRLDQAEENYKQALEIQKKVLGDHPNGDYIRTLRHLASLYEDMARYEAAEFLYREILDIQKKLGGDKDSDYARTLDDLADMYRKTARYDQAEALYEQGLDLLNKIGDTWSANRASTLFGLAELNDKTGHYEQAIERYRQAFEIQRKGMADNHGDFVTLVYADRLEEFASSCELSKGYDTAEWLYIQALEIRKKLQGDQHPSYAESLESLGDLYLLRRRYEEAETLYKKAVDIEKNAFGEDSADYASGISHLANLYENMGRSEQAEPLLQKAVEIRKKERGGQHPDYAESLMSLGWHYMSVGQYDKAELRFRQAVGILKNTNGEPQLGHATHPISLANALSSLASALDANNHADQAAPLLLQSAQLRWDIISELFPSLSELQKNLFLQRNASSNPFVDTNGIASLVLRGGNRDFRTGLEGVLLTKQLLFEAARQENAAMQSVIEHARPEWQERQRELQKKKDEYSALSSRKKDLEKLPDLNKHFERLPREIEQLEEELRQNNPEYAAQARLQRVSLEDVSRELKPGQALVEYVYYTPYNVKTHTFEKSRYGAFVLRGETHEVSGMDLGEGAAIDATVIRYRKLMTSFIADHRGVEVSSAQSRRSESALGQTSWELRKQAWQPLEKALTGVTRVYVAPDGLLNLVPFEALAEIQASGSWKYLAEKRELVYLGTGRDLGRLALSASPQSVGARSAVLIGDPNFNATPEALAHVVAGLKPSASTALVAQSSTVQGTLGIAGGNEKRLEIPRNWVPLPQMGELINKVKEQLEGLGWSVTPLTAKNAVEEAVEQVHSPRILQFATHGYILDRPNNNPQGWDDPLMRSMLILAGANHAELAGKKFFRVGETILTEEQAQAKGLSVEQLQNSLVELTDGVLTAYQVTGMNLSGTELVNLTACETGLGEVTPDGVAGLRQAFLLAGARSLTMSMWEVPRDETKEQVSDFYRRWLGEPPPASRKSVPGPMPVPPGTAGSKATVRYEAFHAAQLASLASARKNHGSGHPFYWAGTIYFGDPGDLPITPEATPKMQAEVNSTSARTTHK